MKTKSVLGALTLCIAGLAGCSEADQRSVLIAAAARTCAANIDTQRLEQQNPLIPAEIDPLRLCTCILERAADGRSLAELRDAVANGGPLPDPQALTQCAMEEGRRSGVLPSGT